MPKKKMEMLDGDPLMMALAFFWQEEWDPIGGCDDQLILFYGRDGNLKNLIKD
jgi:hypothetical protein